MTPTSDFLSVEIGGATFQQFTDTLSQEPYNIRNQDDRERIIRGSIQASALFLPRSTGNNVARTSLLVGNVQSGKTTSIRGIICLAVDSQVPLIVLMTGTKRVLYNQTVSEMTAFFQRYCHRSITCLDVNIPSSGGEIQRAISNFYSDSPQIRQRRQSVFIPILKNANNVNRLIELLQPLASTNLDGLLIIDDEGDEFSLNTTANNPNQSDSACYVACTSLRSLLPCATTYLQVTATPQGPLLISQNDPLSPEYASLSEPGSEYIGGEDYFPPHTDTHPLILHVPDSERPQLWINDPLTRSQIPPTLRQAFHYFLAAGSYLLAKDVIPYVTMMVHPAIPRPIHDHYRRYIERLIDEKLGLEEQDPEQFRIDVFQALTPYYLRLGVLSEINESEDLRAAIYSKILDILLFKEIKVINTGNQLPAGSAFWGVKSSYFILGAHCIARGFVVRNLLTTYLPRDTNPGNPAALLGQIDTIQQQARFFGYKRRYMHFCRVFLRPRIHQQFSEYVIHEGVMRKVLNDSYGKRNPYNGIQLPIPVQFRPTRRNVLANQFPIANFGQSWNLERYPHIVGLDCLLQRQQIFSDLVRSCFPNGMPTGARIPSSETELTVSDLVEFLTRLSNAAFPSLDGAWRRTTATMLSYLVDRSARNYDQNRQVKVFLFPALRSQYPADVPLMSHRRPFDLRFVRNRFEVNDFANRSSIDRFELNPHGGPTNDRDSHYFDPQMPTLHIFHFVLPHYFALLRRVAELDDTPGKTSIIELAEVVGSSERLHASSLSLARLDDNQFVPIVPSLGLRLPDLITVLDL